MNLPERIRYYRKAAGMTAAALAEKLGVSSSCIYNYEHGIREPSYEQLEAIADILNVSMAALLGTKDDDLDDLLTTLKTRPELRILFSLAKTATKDDVLRAVAIIEALNKK